ncbi:SRPBCC domain-containing protein [Flavobacterium sp. 5]|uniref:SRPBCC domain-containing protein n=1 Tax=Flavobacterium sp. 5 TaxID=2035199 RepID=UPI000C2BBB6E|nr:SRPBCC domain-containing protein [Flavobacterium sp. 5]PKB18137.1 activator of Hsp90 ATPase-like protein [Flavobacterium sp. 5]
MAANISRIKINASKQKVWDTLTKAEFVKLWQYGSKLQTTWEVGSSIRFVTEWEDKIFEQWGTVLEFTPTEKLRYSLFAPRPELEDRPENYFEMIYTLSSDNEQTLLEITQEDKRPNAVQESEQGEENPILQMLKQIAETN